jgi:hypothetical protein
MHICMYNETDKQKCPGMRAARTDASKTNKQTKSSTYKQQMREERGRRKQMR